MAGYLTWSGWPRQATADPLLAVVPADPWKRLGDSAGTGSAIADSPGDQPLIAPKSGQDQPFLSLDPAGPGDIGNDPTDSLLPQGAPPRPPPQLVESAEPPGPQIPFGVAVPPGELSIPIARKTNLEPFGGGAESPSTESAADQPPLPPGSPQSADPAPAGRLESDPTTVTGGVEFRQGETAVRLGRAAKITRPRLDLAARADLFSGARPFIVLKIRTDSSGNVIHADVFRTSGSANIDQPCRLAAYKWWFEPPKDSEGKPQEDVFLFSIRFI